MATIYRYDINNQNELFRGHYPVNNTVSIPVLSELGNFRSLAIISDVGVQLPEATQFFLSFDDVVHWLHFGKGLGSLFVKGMLLFGCEGNGSPPGQVALFSAFSQMRGRAIPMVICNVGFNVVLTVFNFTISQEPAPAVDFTLNFQIVDSTITRSRR